MWSESCYDGLDGAAEISAFLISVLGPRWTPRRVYEVADRGGLPILKIPGAGLVARKSALIAYIEVAERAAAGKDVMRSAQQDR
jgi:hypothetical protein